MQYMTLCTKTKMHARIFSKQKFTIQNIELCLVTYCILQPHTPPPLLYHNHDIIRVKLSAFVKPIHYKSLQCLAFSRFSIPFINKMPTTNPTWQIKNETSFEKRKKSCTCNADHKY